MAKIIDATPLSANRIQDIAAAIYNTCATGNMDFEAVVDAKDVVDEKSKAAGSKREEIMAAIAKLSGAGKWIPREVDLAAKSAITMHNNVKTKKAMETFIGEIKHSAHPDVRGHFDALLAIRNAAWQEETDQLAIDKAAATPLRKCFKRSYHALIQSMVVCAKGVVFTTVADMVDYAIANDPDKNAAAVYKKIETLRKQLEDFAVDFPADDLRAAADTLGKLSFNELQVAQERRLADTNPPTVAAATPAANVVVAPTPTPVPDADKARLAKAFTAATVVTPHAAPAAPIDQLDNLLGDNLELKSAA